MLAMASAEAQGDEPTQKRVATRRLGDPVPEAGSAARPKNQRAKKRSKARR